MWIHEEQLHSMQDGYDKHQEYMYNKERNLLIDLIKYYEDTPLTIGLEEPEFLVDKFLDSINKK